MTTPTTDLHSQNEDGDDEQLRRAAATLRRWERKYDQEQGVSPGANKEEVVSPGASKMPSGTVRKVSPTILPNTVISRITAALFDSAITQGHEGDLKNHEVTISAGRPQTPTKPSAKIQSAVRSFATELTQTVMRRWRQNSPEPAISRQASNTSISDGQEVAPQKQERTGAQEFDQKVGGDSSTAESGTTTPVTGGITVTTTFMISESSRENPIAPYAALSPVEENDRPRLRRDGANGSAPGTPSKYSPPRSSPGRGIR